MMNGLLSIFDAFFYIGFLVCPDALPKAGFLWVLGTL